MWPRERGGRVEGVETRRGRVASAISRRRARGKTRLGRAWSCLHCGAEAEVIEIRPRSLQISCLQTVLIPSRLCFTRYSPRTCSNTS